MGHGHRPDRRGHRAVALLDADITLRALAIIIGTSQAAQGVLSVAAAWRAPSGQEGRRLHLITGWLLIAGGASSVASASAGTRSLIIASALWFVIVGFQDFTDAIKTRPRRLWNVALGTVSLLAAVLILAHPDLSLAVTAHYIGITLIARGTLLIGRSSVHRHQEVATPRCAKS